MKLLLTSAGVTNKKIADELEMLVRKKASEIKICIVSTAAYPEFGNKDWYFTQYNDLAKFGFKWVDFTDISNPNLKWKERLEKVDVIFLSGGNTFYLLAMVKKYGLGAWIKKHPKKVYIGASAGSIIMTPSIAVAGVEPADDNFLKLKDLRGLNFVDFEISPHTPNMVSYINAEAYSESCNNSVYLLDDNSAISVNQKKIRVIGTGKYKLITKKVA